jgi:alpha-1,2-mannosyltransferase
VRGANLIRGGVLLAAVGAIVVLVLPLSPAYDLNVFLRAGNAVLHGGKIYPRIGSPEVYSGSSFVYPVLSVVPFVPLAALPVHLATLLFFALCAAAVIAATRLASGDRWIPLIVLCTAFTITGLQLGAISPLLLVGAVCMWKLRHRPLIFGLIAAPVVVSKLFLAPLLVWPLLARRYRACAWASSLAVVLLAIGFVAGPLGLSAYARLLSALGSHEARSGFGLISVLRNAGLTAAAAEAVGLGLVLALFAGAHARYRRSADERVLFCAGIVGALLLTPVLWGHYLVLLPAALLVLDAPRHWFLVLALASWVIAPPHGLHWTLPVPEQLESSGPWLAIAVSLLVFAYPGRSGRASLEGHAARR